MTGRRPSAATLLLLLALLGQGCTTTPPPPPSPTPAATPTPVPVATATPTPAPPPTPSPSPPPDGVIDMHGLRHDSRDLLYRTPGGAVPAGTPVTLRLRTAHGDLTAVRLRTFSHNTGEEALIPMSRAAQDVDCYEPGRAPATCDFWAATLANQEPDNIWYRFIVEDGPTQAFYADDTPALDGGVGAATAEPIDDSYALTVFHPEFVAPEWASGAVIYQLFPDRFRNGDPSNDPRTGDRRYDDPVLALSWDTLPEGYCRFHADATATCPWRFEDDPPEWSPAVEGPRNRDYMGGDLRGVIEKLDYLHDLGIDVIYFNPIFDGGSNHGYDTQDYTRIDPYFGTQADFDELIAEASQRGMRVILDGVFNHMSSDSPFFDRYGHYDTLGACESVDSPWRHWFYFRLAGPEGGPCAAPGGPGRMVYDAWFGFDTIPTINKTRPDVVEYFLTAEDSITRRWLEAGAAGWRQDVSGDPSFPAGYWETFREVVKAVDPQALTISETWQKDGTLLRNLRGDRFDTTMNYRLRDAVLGLLTPTHFDSKGFPDSGRPLLPSQFATRMLAQQEDYAPAAYFTLMNLLDTHDTERALWALTPGPATSAARELDEANVAEGKQRLRLASLIQFTVPGMPTVYYGDEVGLTGGDDPGNRRTYPWADLGGSPDEALYAHYRALAQVRRDDPALIAGDLRMLLVDDAAGTLAYGRRTNTDAAIVALNTGGQAQPLEVAVAGFVPDGTTFQPHYVGADLAPAPVTAGQGLLRLQLPPLSGVVLLIGGDTVTDLEAPAAPVGLAVSDEGDAQIALAWQPVAEAAGYNVYRSPLSGGGWVRVNEAPHAQAGFVDTGLANGRPYHYVVTALDAAGNESAYSNEAAGLPHLAIDEARVSSPAAIEHVISTVNATEAIHGRARNAATAAAGPAPTLSAQLGYGPTATAPATDAAWRWLDAPFAGDADGWDEFAASLLPDAVGAFDYVFRFTTTDGRDWVYADLGGPFEGLPAQPGRLNVVPSDDTTPPPAPTGLAIGAASIAGVELSWEPVVGDPSLHGYEVGRASEPGGPFTTIALVEESSFVDLDISGTATIWYVVRAVDRSWNRSAASEPVEARPGPRLVEIVFSVTIPEPIGRALGRTVHIAGTLHRLDPSLPEWDPAGVALTRVDDTHWTVTLHSYEGVQVEYKYVLGTWDLVEKGENCEEISNRRLTVAFGEGGQQLAGDTVVNWRNVGDCPN